jgi:hypothetical protein
MLDLNAEIADVLSAAKGFSLRLGRVARVMNRDKIDTAEARQSLLRLSAQLTKVGLMLDRLWSERNRESGERWMEEVRLELRDGVDTLYRLEALTSTAH